MAKTVETLKENSTQLNVAMLYISDHGESLGEGGLYLHGMPYSIAPETQTKVPFILWVDDNKIRDDGLDYACIERRAKNDNFSHDNLSHTLLGLMNIETEAKDKSLDILEACKK
jgi:lipid A ethanolaminephosphotransferase